MHHWLELDNCPSLKYLEDFEKPKIVWKIIGNQMAFAIDLSKYMVNNACYILTGSSLKYLLAFLNSNAIKWYSFITNMNKTGVGDVQIGGQNIILFPIPLQSEFKQKLFADVVDEIFVKKANNEDINVLESQIENMVNELYGLTQEEIKALQA